MSVPPPPTSPRPSALRSLLLLAAVLAGLVVVRWSVTGGLSRPLAPPAQTRVHASPAPTARDLAGLRGTLLYMGGRQVLAVDAASGTISSIPSPGAGRVRVLRQGEYLVLLARDGGAAAQRADLKSKPVLLGDAIDVLPSPRSDRVWLVSQDETAPEQAYVLREVELTSSRKLRRWTLPYDAEPVAVVPPGVGCCLQVGAFSPDARLLAVFTQLAGPGQPGLSIVDVASGRASVLPGSGGATPLACQPCLGWSHSGWLFFFNGGAALADPAAWRPGAPAAIPLALDLRDVTTVLPSGLAPGSPPGSGAAVEEVGEHLHPRADLALREGAVAEHQPWRGRAARQVEPAEAVEPDPGGGRAPHQVLLVGAGRQLDHGVQAGGGAPNPQAGRVPGERAHQRVAAAPVAGTAGAQVAVVGAGGEQVREGELLQGGRAEVGVVLGVDQRGQQVPRRHQPAEP